MALTTLQLTNYQSEGFLVLNDFVDPTSCDELRDRIIEMIREFEPVEVASIFSTREQNRIADEYFLNSANNISFFFEENAFNSDGALKQDKELSINKIGHALHDLDPVFDGFSRTSTIRQLASDLGINNPLLLQSMYIFKQPHIGGEVNCHQDCAFLYTKPHDILGLWFALEDATLENGCLWVLPGGHQRGLKSRWARTEKGMQFETFDSSPWAEEELIPLEVRKGSLIVLNGLLPHRSLENRSPKSRHAYTLHIISSDSHYPADNWLQRSADLPLRGF
jgi:phytanoyl-CoA hydroxylase